MLGTIPDNVVLAVAESWLGTPYVDQASLKGVGCDCLGLLRGIWRDLYDLEEPQAVPPYNRLWGERRGDDLLLNSVRKYLVECNPMTYRTSGRVIVFRMFPNADCKHVGITGYNDMFIHAYEGRGVVYQALSAFWIKRIAAVAAFPAQPKGLT
jgi:NlpC/P60 family putative phage cell wall peptidase